MLTALALCLALAQAPAAPGNVAIGAAPAGDWMLDVVADFPEMTSGGGVATPLDSRTLSDFSGGSYLVWNIQGRVRVTVTKLAGPNAVLSAILLDPGTASTSPVRFLRGDIVTQGTWKGTFGNSGALISADTATLPPDTVTVTGASDYTWSPASSDSRALQRIVGSNRVMAAWYGDSFAVDIDAGPDPRQLALYAADYDSSARAERIDLSRPPTAADLTVMYRSGWEIAALLDGQIVRTQLYDTFPNEDKGQAHYRLFPDLLPDVGRVYTIALRYRGWSWPDPLKAHLESFTPWVPAQGRVMKLPNGRLTVVP